MASGGPSPREGRKRKKKSDGSLRGKSGNADESQVQADIDKLTSSGHSALKRGDCAEALICFKKAYKAAVEVQLSHGNRSHRNRENNPQFHWNFVFVVVMIAEK